jgi:hypothetical protein
MIVLSVEVAANGCAAFIWEVVGPSKRPIKDVPLQQGNEKKKTITRSLWSIATATPNYRNPIDIHGTAATMSVPIKRATM